MKTKYFILAAIAGMTFASCSNDEFIGDNSPTLGQEGDGSIQFSYGIANTTRAGEFIGATAADMLGGMFVVEGTKGTEVSDAPSSTVVFDNYLVGYEYNSAGKTESNTNNWEYVGKQTGITIDEKTRMSAETWAALHSGVTTQSIKYWDYSVPQYDFIAWSTGDREAIATGDVASGKVKVTKINTGNTLATNGFTLSAYNATDLSKCYYTDINKVLKANYGNPVTLTFKNMAAKVRVAIYETVPGYSVQNVKFYSADSDNGETVAYDPTDLGGGTATATLFTTGTGDDFLPTSGSVLVCYPFIGTGSNSEKAYNKASVTVTAGDSKSSTQTFGTFPSGTIGTTLPDATYAGDAADANYTAVFPNSNGKALTLRVDYTLVSTDGSGETIKVYGAKAVVPATYTVWQPNYAYTYIFKISDNTNGWTSTSSTDPKGLFPITFDAVVASFTDVNAEQRTVTTVATPSITTYQQGHDKTKNEYSKSQLAGKDQDNVKDVYVQVMDNSTTTPTLKADLNTAGKSLLYKITKGVADYVASEAEVMDALQNRTNEPTGSETPEDKRSYLDANPVGRNGITLTKDATHLSNTETSIVNGVDDQPITKIAGTTITAGKVAKIDIDNLAVGTYAYVYSTPPTSEEKVYNVVSDEAAEDSPASYYEIELAGTEDPITDPDEEAADGMVYFVKNVDAGGNFVSYTFKQTKVGDKVKGLVKATIGAKATTKHTDSDGHYYFYFDVYYQNNGSYAVKVIKVVA